MENIGIRIRQRREALGLTVWDLSRAASIRENNIHNWEAGRRIPSDMEALARLAEALDTTTDFLIRGTSPVETAQ